SEDFDLSYRGNTNQPKSEQAAQLPDPRIAHMATVRCVDREPDFITGRTAIDTLKDKLQVESKLELLHDHNGTGHAAQRYDVAAADLAFYLQTEAFQVALDRQVERSLQSDSRHGSALPRVI